MIYFASKADSIITLFAVLAVICGIVIIGKLMITESIIKPLVILCFIFTMIAVITPNTETIYTIAVVNELTPDNIQAIGKTGKDAVDYIIEQVDKVLDDKEK